MTSPSRQTSNVPVRLTLAAAMLVMAGLALAQADTDAALAGRGGCCAARQRVIFLEPARHAPVAIAAASSPLPAVQTAAGGICNPDVTGTRALAVN